jgi:hypothetical protein
MSKLRKAIKVILINLVILVVLVEIVSVAAYYFQSRTFFYAHSAHNIDPALSVTEPTGNQGGGQQLTVQQLHPYFGFIDKVGLAHPSPYSQTSHSANNFGFGSIYNYPFKKQSPNQFLVGVFGGSVAAIYAFFEMDRQILATSLKKLPALADKEIIILPFAIGGYKQPQQLLVMNYFLSIGQDLDLAINIDGFNEVALAYLNYQHGVESSMPSDFILLPMVNLATGNLSKEELELTLGIIRAKEGLANANRSLAASRTATGYELAWIQSHYLLQNYREDIAKLDQLRVAKGRSEQTYMQIPAGPSVSADQALSEMAERWAKASLMMKQLLDQRNIPYFQFVQPNQYAETPRVFSEKEKAVAFVQNSPFKLGAGKGYPLLLAELGKLQQAGLQAFSAVKNFDEVSEPVYADNCCHYNEAGNTIFCNFIASTITQALSKDARLNRPTAASQ